MNEKQCKLLVILAVNAGGVLLISNLVAVKIWSFLGVPVDGGIVLFPISYIIGDVIIELYGRRIARMVIWQSLLLNVLAVAAFWVVGELPAHPEWQLQEAYQSILWFVPRIVLASLLAYLVSQLINNLVFEKIKQETGQKKLWLRALGSSMVARLCDTMIFETVAFFGVLSLTEFTKQAIFAYGAGMILEVILTPLTYLVVKIFREYGKFTADALN